MRIMSCWSSAVHAIQKVSLNRVNVLCELWMVFTVSVRRC